MGITALISRWLDIGRFWVRNGTKKLEKNYNPYIEETTAKPCTVFKLKAFFFYCRDLAKVENIIIFENGEKVDQIFRLHFKVLI